MLAPPQPKQKVIAIVLAAIPITSFLGIHYFYLGWTALGILRCASLTLFCCAPIPYLGWIVGAFALLGHLGWYAVDVVRASCGSLKPADGSELV